MKIKSDRPPLIIPVENQVRELDPKLLLACIAARKGFVSILGSHREIDLRIASLPKSIYLNKSMTNRNLRMLEILNRLGHEIMTWDEEALVHLPPEIYYSRRLCPVTIRLLSHLYAWGEDNATLWRQYPKLPARMPIHVTGNPRGDLLRPELRIYYNDEAAALKKAHGDFILVNTNFNHVNAFFPAQNLFKPVKQEGDLPPFGKAAVGMPRAYAEGLRDHKQAVFESFRRMIPRLDTAFPQHNIVIRPHPTENQEIYQRIAEACNRVTVTNEGNIVPWLMATRAVIHNGCTTGVEAYMLDVPALSYRAVVDDDYDMGFYRLPNLVSHQCFSWDELQSKLGQVFQGQLGVADGDERAALVRQHLAGQQGPLACQNIMDVIANFTADTPTLPGRGAPARAAGWLYANGRRLVKRIKAYLPGSHAPPSFHRHRYPEISAAQLNARIARFQEVLHDHTPIRASRLMDQIFLIQGADNTES